MYFRAEILKFSIRRTGPFVPSGFNPARVAHHSLGSPQRGAPQETMKTKQNPNGVRRLL